MIIQSQAFAKLHKILPTHIPWLIDLKTLSISLMEAFSVDTPFLKPVVLWPVCC
jgi:hypothetical protein